MKFVVDIFFECFEHALEITGIIFLMMIVVDALGIYMHGKFGSIIRGKGKRQYILASFIGAIPGCFGAYTNVSFYMGGILSLGAVTAGMISATGESAFVMLALFPKVALLMMAILIVAGMLLGPLADRLLRLFRMKTHEGCEHEEVHEEKNCFSFAHYVREHIVGHILKHHIWKIFLWSFSALLLVRFGFANIDIEGFIRNNPLAVIVASALIGLIPDTAPHVVVVVLYSKGLIPFSALLTTSFIQEGHAILPLLSYSIRDAVSIKVFKFVIGLILGLILCLAGF